MRFRFNNCIMNIRISEVKMQKSESNHAATAAHRKVKASTTLNRRYVKRPTRSNDVFVSVKKSSKIKHFDIAPVVRKNIQEDPIAPAVTHPMQATAISRMQARKVAPTVSKMTAKELKDQAIKKALANAAKITNENEQVQKDDGKTATKMHFGIGRIMLAISCATAAVFAIIYFVNINMPDISMRVAAMQTGIEASYPSYIPKDFTMSSISSEENKIILKFKDTSNNEFSLIEENSTWDSNALLTNFVKNAYGDNYSIIREQGLTIYVNDEGATWVNGGILYKIENPNGLLSKQKISLIAVSL